MTYLMRLNQINFRIITPEKDEHSGLNTYSAKHLCLLMLICQYEHAYKTWGEEVQTIYYEIICISSTMPIRPNRSHCPMLVVIIECIWGD